MKCALCGEVNRSVLVRHHISYNPPEIIVLCGNCHTKIHRKANALCKGFLLKTEETRMINFFLKEDMVLEGFPVFINHVRDLYPSITTLIQELKLLGSAIAKAEKEWQKCNICGFLVMSKCGLSSHKRKHKK